MNMEKHTLLISCLSAAMLMMGTSYGLVVYWDPPSPAPGDTVRIHYNVVEGTLPDNTDPVYIHLGVDGWQNTHDYEMTRSTPGGEWWEYAYAIPTDISVIDFVFTDLQGNWDNNGGMGIDWHISLDHTWDPFSPTPNDSVRIVIRNSTQGGSILWYVLSNGHAFPPVPQYRPIGSLLTPDGEAVESPLLGPDQDGSYFLFLGPFSSASQLVDFVKFKIHWADGSWESSLYEIPIDYSPQPEDPLVSIVSPAEDETITGPVEIEISASDAAQVEIWGGIDSLGVFTNDPYHTLWSPSTNNFGRVLVIAKALAANGRISFDRVQVEVVPTIVHEPAPPGIDDGLTVTGHGITFALYAPAKEYVAICGNFNRSFPNGELMKLSGDTLWWTSQRLSDGDYWYQYNLEGIKRIADPWSADVQWKQPGTMDESGNYQHARSRFLVGEIPFQWADGDFVRPSVEKLVVYELHVSDFAARPDGSIGTYQDVLAKIDEGYFDSLGINVVELMPLNEFEGENSWGYNPSFYLAPETAYGTPGELKTLIDRFHHHGIAVLLDVVFNHLWGSAPLFQLYQPLDEWDYREHDYDNCPYFHDQPSQWGYKLQHWQEVNGRRYRTWKHVTDALRTWVEEYHLDGFRYDVAWGVGWDGYNQNGMSFYTWYLNNLDSTLIQIIEEDNAYRVNTTETDAAWNFSYFHALKANLQQINDSGHSWGNMSSLGHELSYASQGFDMPYGPLNYLESHDETRIIYEATVYQDMDHQTAIKKSKLGATVLLTGTGTPMLYAGQEFAQNGISRDEYGNIMPQPLQWQNLQTAPGVQLFQHYRRLIWLRRNLGILTSNSFAIRSASNATKHIVYWRGGTEDDEQVVVAANFDTMDHAIDVEFPDSGIWYEFTEDDSMLVLEGELAGYVLPASSARVFVNERIWPTAVDGIGDGLLPESLMLSQNYPNPYARTTRIECAVPKYEYGPVRLEIVNLSGQLVSVLTGKIQGAGHYTFEFTGRDSRGRRLPSAVYLYRARGRKEATPYRRMVLLR